MSLHMLSFALLNNFPAYGNNFDLLNSVSTKNTKISWAWWCAPIVPATWEAEAGELLEPGRQMLQ